MENEYIAHTESGTTVTGKMVVTCRTNSTGWSVMGSRFQDDWELRFRAKYGDLPKECQLKIKKNTIIDTSVRASNWIAVGINSKGA